MKRRIVLIWLLSLAAGVLCYLYVGSSTPSGQPPLTRLDTADFGELRGAFNAAKDSVRVVALLSPT